VDVRGRCSFLCTILEFAPRHGEIHGIPRVAAVVASALWKEMAVMIALLYSCTFEGPYLN
jgi:hypothetical protein